VGGEHAYVLVEEWLGTRPPPLERTEALGRLSRRYLLGHGPASSSDLAKWAGITLGDARLGLGEIQKEIAEGRIGLTLSGSSLGLHGVPPPRLLGAFDPLLHGWGSRQLFLGDHRGVVTTNGIFRPIALVEGNVVATWRLTGYKLEIVPLEKINRNAHDALIADGADVVRFLGGR
jgi:hypothetical protein